MEFDRGRERGEREERERGEGNVCGETKLQNKQKTKRNIAHVAGARD